MHREPSAGICTLVGNSPLSDRRLQAYLPRVQLHLDATERSGHLPDCKGLARMTQGGTTLEILIEPPSFDNELPKIVTNKIVVDTLALKLHGLRCSIFIDWDLIPSIIKNKCGCHAIIVWWTFTYC